MATITTHTGDNGTTGLLGPERVRKDDPRIEALGALDEAQSALGLARSFAPPLVAERLLAIQRELYRVMGELSTSGQPDGVNTAKEFDLWTSAEQVEALEREIVAWRETIPSQFIIPGDNPLDGALHLSRALIRRAERRVVTLEHHGLLSNPETLRYLNRLSDWVYTYAQVISASPPVPARARRKRERQSNPSVPIAGASDPSATPPNGRGGWPRDWAESGTGAAGSEPNPRPMAGESQSKARSATWTCSRGRAGAWSS
ncbi:MAG: cob(I)yrinic acid a,c-diamide adenosyltransferase, partial [Dehalococcoidia bacterium]|nr:cob(I)yrinic acid a,c-diamide adenosyltransferase [Dehalococcoidia bacterium]